MIEAILSTPFEYAQKLALMITGGGMATGFVAVTIIGLAIRFGYKIPIKLFNIFKRKFTVTVEVAGQSPDSSVRTARMFNHLTRLVANNQKSKRFKLDRLGTDGIPICSIPTGSGHFFVKGRLFWYTKSDAKKDTSTPPNIRITGFAKSALGLLENLELDEYKKSLNVRQYFSFSCNGWGPEGDIIQDRKIFLAPEIKEIIDKKVDFFKENKKWCESKEISHKLLIILPGEPGTGKSAIARYVADRLKFNLGSVTGGDFVKAVRRAADSNIVVSSPDFDSIGIGKVRQAMIKEPGRRLAQPDPDITETTTLTDVLNLFEGDIPLNNSVVVMSTNCIDDVDPALYRGSRCDLILELPYLKYPQVNEFTKHYYETTDDLSDEFKDISIKAGDLMGTFKENAFSKEDFLTEIRKFIPRNIQQDANETGTA